MLVGEQPGDVEDIQGRPFVGPAGRLLRDLLDDLGLSRSPVYLTNAVKHFSFVERGKRRLHKKPTTGEVMACRPWILEELTIVRPRVVVALGATAALTLFGRQASVTRDRGKRLALSDEMQALVGTGLVTYHPSAALRAPSPEQRKQVRDWLRADLELAARLCSGDRHANDSTMAPPNAD
jgi:DNA polymerase